MAFVRRSKYKHIYGKANKREQCYDAIRITKSSWDSTFCSVNPKYLAIITESAGGGAFLVLPLDKVGRVEADQPLVAGHKASVLDIQWCPFNDDLIASASEDCTAKVWLIPEGGLDPKVNLTEPVADLVGHQRRVGLVVWHPTAENVLLTSGADNLVILWNVETEEPMIEISFPDMIMSASFNYNGSKLVTACKDRSVRIVNPRTGEVVTEGKCHDGSKPQQCIYLKNDQVFTTGFSKISERQYAVWNDTDLDAPLTIQDLDTTNGVLFPFYDPDCSLIFLCGKGDSCIRYFEVTDEEPYVHYINMITSSDPQRGMGFINKRALNVNNNEIARCYKLLAKGLCEVIPFTVPRKSELFQDDLYPDTAAPIPGVSAEDWIAGKDVDPILASMKDSYVAKERKTRTLKSSLIASKLGTAPDSTDSPKPAKTRAITRTVEPAKRQPSPEPEVEAPKTVAARVQDTIEVPEPKPEPKSPVPQHKTITPAPPSVQAPPVAPPAAPLAAPTAPAAAPVDLPYTHEEVVKLLEDMRKLKIVLKGHERRIQMLEDINGITKDKK